MDYFYPVMRARKAPFELIVWTTAIVYLALINPEEQHISLCLLHLIGMPWCPGCGIGHAISFLLHGEVMSSFRSHPLGLFALVVLVSRIIKLIKMEYYHYIGRVNPVNSFIHIS
ncbi:MAG: DUF2752 domain-containing protein [Bacteroidetes bacterium]|nr:DUF2752 domain-containing protein [Bacteroidota bacterium]